MFFFFFSWTYSLQPQLQIKLLSHQWLDGSCHHGKWMSWRCRVCKLGRGRHSGTELWQTPILQTGQINWEEISAVGEKPTAQCCRRKTNSTMLYKSWQWVSFKKQFIIILYLEFPEVSLFNKSGFLTLKWRWNIEAQKSLQEEESAAKPNQKGRRNVKDWLCHRNHRRKRF